MPNYKSYIKALPSGFLRESLLRRPYRKTEIDSIYKILLVESLYEHLRGSLYFSEREQLVFDADIFAKRSSTNAIDHMPQVSNLTKLTIGACERVLDRCEGVCVLRDNLYLDPIPPRNYPNRFSER